MTAAVNQARAAAQKKSNRTTTTSMIQINTFATNTRISHLRRLIPVSVTDDGDSRDDGRVALSASTSTGRVLTGDIIGEPRAKGLIELTQYGGCLSFP